MKRPIKILVADDHTIVRQGIARLLDDQPNLEVVGEAVNGQMAVKKAETLNPDIIILDIAMPVLNGIEAAKKIRKNLPKAKILILSMHSHEHHIHELLEAGISGYLIKDSSGRDIINAIQAAMNNEIFLSPSISKVVIDKFLSSRKKSPREERFNLLTNREREVFQLIAEGYSNRRIAETLFVSTNTVKSHRTKIMDKLQVENLTELIHFALQLRLIEPKF